LVKKAEKNARGSFMGGAKYEEAAELFTKAGNTFKISKQWDKAGDAFVRAAECYLKLKDVNYEAAQNYINAVLCYKKTNVTVAVQCMRRGIEIFKDEGKFSTAAKYQKDLGELFEGQPDPENALDAYQASADLYESSDAPKSASPCLLKVAQLSAQLERYDKAAELYERMATEAIDNNLQRYSVKDYLLRAGLCRLVTDVVATERALEEYASMDATFASQREYTFLTKLVTSIKNYDEEAFSEAALQYDEISKLDSWKTSILLKIKKQIKEEELLV